MLIKNIQTGVLGCILAVQSFYDIRKKELPSWVTLAGGIIGILLWVAKGEFYLEQLAALLPGILCLLFAKLSREAMGYGDGLLIIMMGIYLKTDKIITVCMWAFCIAGVAALFLLVSGKKKGKQAIPFVPFLFAAFLLEVFINASV